MTKPVAFRQSDLLRALRVAEAAGLRVSRFVINDNGIEIVIGEPEKTKGPRSLDRLHAA